MALTITWDAAQAKFKLSGSAMGADIGDASSGNWWYGYSFSGTKIRSRRRCPRMIRPRCKVIRAAL